MHPTDAENLWHIDFAFRCSKRQTTIRGTAHNPFAGKGRWLRANLHCHLTETKHDPRWPETALDQYRRLGYDVVAGMDHDQIVHRESRSAPLVIPGAEITCGGQSLSHLVALGIDTIPKKIDEGERAYRIADMIKKVKALGGITILSHPGKSNFSWEDLNCFCRAGLDGIEVVNSGVYGDGNDRADQIWHMLLAAGWVLPAIGNDDAHGPRPDLNSSKEAVSRDAWTGILCDDVSREGVLNAIRSGRTYASEGPEIHRICLESDGRLIVDCAPAAFCHVRSSGGGKGGTCIRPSEEEGTSAEQFVFEFAAFGHRIRDSIIVVLQDHYGRRAWSSPIPITFIDPTQEDGGLSNALL